MNEDLKTALFGTLIVAGAATALILWQHALHTGQIIAQFGGASLSMGGDGSQASGRATSPASIAGTPSPGQSNLVPLPAATMPLVVGANFQMNGTTGPTGGSTLGWSN